MATLSKARQSAVSGKVPTPFQLALGELAVNTTDGIVFLKKTDGMTERVVRLNASEDGVTTVALGGTGSTNATDARGALGLGTLAVQAADSVAISGGAIDGTPIGATAASTGAFTNVAMSGVLEANAPAATAGYQFTLTNTSTLVNSWAAYCVGNAAGDAYTLRMGTLGTSYATQGAYIQDGGFIEAGGSLSGGLSIIARAAAANFRLYLGGYATAALRLQVATNGIITGTASSGTLAYTHLLTNSNTGQAYSCFYAANGATSADGTGVLTCGTGFATSGAYVQNGGVLEAGANLSGGLGIMARHTAGNLRFYTGGYQSQYERMHIDAAGLVGIGTVAPGAKLQVTGAGAAADATILAKATSAAAGTYGSVEVQSDSTAYLFSRTYSLATVSNSFGVPLGGYSLIASSGAASLGLLVGTTTATPLVLGTNSTSRIVIDAGGNVGINSTAPPVSPSAGAAGMLTLERASTYVPVCAYAYVNSPNGGGMIVLGKSRSTTKGVMAETLANDALGYVTFEGVTTALGLASPAAYIQGSQDGASGAAFVPGRLDFYTGTNAAVASHRMTVTSVGVGIGLGGNVAPRSNLSLGPIASTPSTTPANMDFGGSHSSVAGANLKLRLWTDGTLSYGLGISSNQMDYVVQSTANHAWWRGAAKTMTLDTGDRLLVGVASANTAGGVLQLKSGITFPATAVASTDPNTLDDYREATFTATATGMTTAPTGVVSFVRVGKAVTLEIPAIAGTSNLTTFTLTGGPVAMRPSAARVALCRVQDNSGSVSVGMATIGIDGVITLSKDAAGSAFTASGTKSTAACCLSYYL